MMKVRSPFFAEPIKQHSTKQITELFKQIDSAIRITEENYSDETRSTRVAREIQNSLACYKELYRERKNTARQLSLDCFIKKVEDYQPVIPGLRESKRVMIQTHQTHSISQKCVMFRYL
jgi:signal recognition particle subunit SEC65